MFKQLKEEMLMIPVLMILVEIIRQFIMKYSPEAGTFIPETELLVFVVKFWQFLWITSGVWILLRIVFPKVYDYLKERVYDEFEQYSTDYKTKISLYLFGLFFLGFILLFNGAKGNSLTPVLNKEVAEAQLRKRLCDTLAKQLYVREATGNNDGVEVERYLKSVGLPKGYSWCAAYAHYNLAQYKVPVPKSARAANYHNSKLKPNVAKPGDVFTLYYSNLGRVGHVGFIVENTHGYYRTNEGNTGGGGVREGDGVKSYLRAKQIIYSVNNYISLKFTSDGTITKNKTSLLNNTLFGNNNKLQQATNKGFGKGTNSFRTKGGFEFIQFQTNLSGYNNYSETRYKYDSTGCARSAEFETSNNRHENAKNHSYSKRWQIVCNNHLQRIGAEAKTYETRNCYIQEARQKQSNRQKRNENNNHNQKRTLQALVAYNAGMDRCNCIGDCNYLCISKNIHCWDA